MIFPYSFDRSVPERKTAPKWFVIRLQLQRSGQCIPYSAKVREVRLCETYPSLFPIRDDNLIDWQLQTPASGESKSYHKWANKHSGQSGKCHCLAVRVIVAARHRSIQRVINQSAGRPESDLLLREQSLLIALLCSVHPSWPDKRQEEKSFVNSFLRHKSIERLIPLPDWLVSQYLVDQLDQRHFFSSRRLRLWSINLWERILVPTKWIREKWNKVKTKRTIGPISPWDEIKRNKSRQ